MNLNPDDRAQQREVSAAVGWAKRSVPITGRAAGTGPRWARRCAPLPILRDAQVGWAKRSVPIRSLARNVSPRTDKAKHAHHHANQPATSAPYRNGVKLNFCPPTLASYINPPLARVKMATPLL